MGQCGAHSAPPHLLRQHSGPDAPPGRQAGACRQGSSAINTPPPLPMLLHQREPAKSRPDRPPAKGFTSLRSRAALVEARQCCMVGGALVPSVWSAECGKRQQPSMQTVEIATRIGSMGKRGNAPPEAALGASAPRRPGGRLEPSCLWHFRSVTRACALSWPQSPAPGHILITRPGPACKGKQAAGPSIIWWPLESRPRVRPPWLHIPSLGHAPFSPDTPKSPRLGPALARSTSQIPS